MGEELKRLLESGFVRDTLFQVSGRPAEIEEMPPLRPNQYPKTMGYYFPSEDRMKIRAGQSEEELVRTLAHEAGHRFRDSIQSTRRGRDDQLLEAVAGRRAVLEQVDDPSFAQKYAASSPNEHFAVAFQRAMNALRTPPGEGREEALQQAEEEIPGVAVLAQYLQRLSPFRKR